MVNTISIENIKEILKQNSKKKYEHVEIIDYTSLILPNKNEKQINLIPQIKGFSSKINFDIFDNIKQEIEKTNNYDIIYIDNESSYLDISKFLENN